MLYILDKNEYASDVIGIDIGSSKCCMSVWRHGQAEIIPNDQGNRVTPSYVAFTDNEILIGDKAKEHAINNPKKTIFDFKQLIGKSINAKEVSENKQSWPFDLLEIESKPIYKIKTKNITKYYTPEYVISIILVYLKKRAENFIGFSVKAAVITVPICFDKSQRETIINAGKKAGFKNISILNESVAAAIVYGFINQKIEKHVLVFDCGGGTFDLLVLKIIDDEYQILANSKSTLYNGNYFDSILTEYFIKEFERETHIYISDSLHCISKLKTQSGIIKCILSTKTEALININSFYNDYNFKSTVKQSQFESMLKYIYTMVHVYLFEVLYNAKIKKADLNDVILVGGLSNIPVFQQYIQDLFDMRIKKTINPIEAVAMGAAIFAKNLNVSNNNSTQNTSKIESNFILSDSESESTTKDIKEKTLRNIKNDVDEFSENTIKSIETKLNDKDQILNHVTTKSRQLTINCPYDITDLYVEIKDKHKINNQKDKKAPDYPYKININYKNDDQVSND